MKLVLRTLFGAVQVPVGSVGHPSTQYVRPVCIALVLQIGASKTLNGWCGMGHMVTRSKLAMAIVATLSMPALAVWLAQLLEREVCKA